MKIGRRLSPSDKGVTETVEKYAFFPKFLSNGDIIWLEKYKETRTWEYNTPGVWSTVGYWSWHSIKREK